MTQDLHNYCKCLWGISYDTRGKFRSSQVEDELLKLLNGVKTMTRTMIVFMIGFTMKHPSMERKMERNTKDVIGL